MYGIKISFLKSAQDTRFWVLDTEDKNYSNTAPLLFDTWAQADEYARGRLWPSYSVETYEYISENK